MQKLQIPNPFKGLVPVEYDLTRVEAAEGRTPEIAFMTPGKAPEMEAVFVGACFKLGEVFSDLHLQHRRAEVQVAKRKAVVVLDVVPHVLADRKAANNAETRQAVVDLDDEYTQAVYVEIEIQAALKMIYCKLKAMEDALDSVKKISAETMRIHNRYNPNLTAPAPELSSVVAAPESSAVVPNEPIKTTPGGARYGKARY